MKISCRLIDAGRTPVGLLPTATHQRWLAQQPLQLLFSRILQQAWRCNVSMSGWHQRGQHVVLAK